MNKGFKIKTKPLDLFQNQSKWSKQRRKERSFRSIYIGFVIAVGIIGFMYSKGMIKRNVIKKQNIEQYGNIK